MPSAKSTKIPLRLGRPRHEQAARLHCSARNSNTATSSTEKLVPFEIPGRAAPHPAANRPLKNMSTPALLRSIILSQVFARPKIASLGMKMMNRIAKSRQPFLDPDRNPVLSRILRATVYDHFCGGWKRNQIVNTLDNVKRCGYTGVILQYAREVVAHDLANSDPNVDISAQQIKQWHDGNLRTLSMVGPGDYMAVKYTGAGGKIANALRSDAEPPAQLSSAIEELCSKARSQGTRILIDAEEQVYQPTIDRWAVDLMRKYNRDGVAVILNTYQAYLKCTRDVMHRHLQLASQEGWTLGVKLVRGAYILIETRSLIHDTKKDTDACYDGIARDLLSCSFDEVQSAAFPNVRLLLAGHNADSIHQASHLRKELLERGVNSGPLDFAQLYGMADHVSGELLAQCENAPDSSQLSEREARLQEEAMPRVFKCVNWGSVRECLGFLTRRAAENQGSADRLLDGLDASKKELWARMLRQ